MRKLVDGKDVFQLLLFILVVLVLAFLPTVNVNAEYQAPSNITGANIIIDGYVTDVFGRSSSGVYINSERTTTKDDRGFISFNVTEIPEGVGFGVLDVSLYLTAYSNGGDITIYEMELNPATASNEDIWYDVGNGTSYYNEDDPLHSENVTYKYDLGDNAVSRLEGQLASDWFAVGLYGKDMSVNVEWWASEGSYPPILEVSWINYSNPWYVFTGRYYENGTRAGSISVTAFNPDGSQDIIPVNGVSYARFTERPEMFTWSLGGGSIRRIYVLNDQENITISTPDDTFSVYEITIKDYVGRTGPGDSYVEAYRSINATEQIIERRLINTLQLVHLNLVVDATYTIKIYYADGTRTTWGFILPNADTTLSLVLNTPEFSDQAQILYNYVSIEGSRTGDTISITYADSRTSTSRVVIVTSVRGGSVINNSTYLNNSTFIHNLAGLNTTGNYVVTLTSTHGDAGVFGWSGIYDGTFNFPDPPRISTFTFGGISSGNLIAYSFFLISLVTFNTKYRGASLMVAMGVSSLLTWIGWASFSYTLLALGWFFAVVTMLVSGEG